MKVRGYPVVRIDTLGCAAVIELRTPSPFKRDDRVLIHQAKGMVISGVVTDSGRPTSQGNCGNYEFATVRGVIGNSVILSTPLVRPYDVAGSVQIVPVISSTTVVINGPLSAEPWDGSSGGIIAIEASESVELNTSIDVSGAGFVGGEVSLRFNSCRYSPRMSDPYPSPLYGQKGEGSASINIERLAGRGRLASGGGGGGNHNAGGGGGGNGREGGIGGAAYGVCNLSRIGGLGGSACIVDPKSPRLFFGGAGGGAHQNESNSSSGGAGGGIVIVASPSVTTEGESRTISSRGLGVARAEHEGASGGGAGGTILLGCEAFIGRLVVDISGGKGGDIGRSFQAPHGPGGGGSGGQILYAFPTIPASITLLTAGGENGINTSYPTGVQHSWYSEPGRNGKVTTNCVLAAEQSFSRLIQLSADDLGEYPVTVANAVSIVFVNEGNVGYRVDSIRSRRQLLRPTGAIPPIPTILSVGDTLIVMADLTNVLERQYFDTLDIYGNSVEGCDYDQEFPFTWSAVAIRDSCSFSAALFGDTVHTGEYVRIVSTINDKSRIFPPAHFTAYIRYNSQDLYIAPSTSNPQISINRVGDETILKIEDDWYGRDTLFVLNAMGLLSGGSVSKVHFDSLFITNGVVLCSTAQLDSAVVLEEVCSSRKLRSVRILNSSATVVTGSGFIDVNVKRDANISVNYADGVSEPASSMAIAVWSVVGNQIEHVTLTHDHARVNINAGTYIVKIVWGNWVLYSGLVMVY